MFGMIKDGGLYMPDLKIIEKFESRLGKTVP